EERWPSAGAFVEALAAGVGVSSAPAPTWSAAPTLEVPKTLPAPAAPPTVVSPATRPAAGTAPPPLPLRPATPSPAPRKAGLAPIAVGLGALGFLGVVAVVGAWLLLGRSQPSPSPEVPKAADGGLRVPALPSPTAPSPSASATARPVAVASNPTPA